MGADPDRPAVAAPDRPSKDNTTVVGRFGRANPLCDVGEQKPVALGDPVKLCIFLSTTPVQRMIFQIKVEQYAQLVLKGSQAKALAALTRDTRPVHAWAAVS